MKYLILLITLVSTSVTATWYGEPGPQGPQGEPGLDGKDYLSEGISDEDVREVFAGAMAIAGIDFTNTTDKTQFGLSAAGFGSANNIGIGIGQVWDSDDIGDILFSFKTLVDEVELDGQSERPWVASAVWKVQLW